MKYPYHIAAFDKQAFGIVQDGINTMAIAELKERAEQSFILIRRHEAETDERFGQVLPYILLRQGDGLFTYQRTSKVGEQRLAGNFSVGIGGHVDMGDIAVWAGHGQPQMIDFLGTLASALGREVDEEIIFTDKDGKEYTLGNLPPDYKKSMTPDIIGIINDLSNPVGRVHYGILMVMTVPMELSVRCAEEELVTVGFQDLKTMTINEGFENWSRLAIEHLRATGE